NRILPETHSLVGWCANGHPLTVAIDDNVRFDELLERVHDMVIGAQAHQEVPSRLVVAELFEELKDSTAAQRLMKGPDVTFSFNSHAKQTLEIGSLEVSPVAMPPSHIPFNLTIWGTETE